MEPVLLQGTFLSLVSLYTQPPFWKKNFISDSLIGNSLVEVDH